MDETRTKTALVLGATGAIGGEVARQLRDAGWTVRALRRGRAEPVQASDGLHWIRGDALQAADVRAAARGCSVIVHAVNPPGYRRWGELVLPMIDNTVAAAIAERATIVLPGTVYNFGPDAFADLHEDAPQRPITSKGRIRVELERRIEDATRQGARAVLVRAGDFFGPSADHSWFSAGLVRAGRPVESITLPNDRGIGHQWAYLPDLARAMVQLLEVRETLPAFARFHFEGTWDPDGLLLAAAIQRVVQRHGGRRPRIGRMPWPLLRVAAPFSEMLRGLVEMRYLWQQPVRMRADRLAAVLGREPRTELDEAVETTLRGLGCLPRARDAGSASIATADA